MNVTESNLSYIFFAKIVENCQNENYVASNLLISKVETPSKMSTKESGVLSVMELTRFIKIQLESRFPTVQVMGEVSNLSRQSSGHIYFSLKDRHASLSCVLPWRSAAAKK